MKDLRRKAEVRRCELRKRLAEAIARAHRLQLDRMALARAASA